MTDLTDQELLGYADEQLMSTRCASIEQSLRTDAALAKRLAALLSQRDQGAHSVGEIWLRRRLSCPPRAVWSAFVDGRLGDGISQYLRFHVETVGCRVCAANLADLQTADNLAVAARRTQKIFQSSAGKLK